MPLSSNRHFIATPTEPHNQQSVLGQRTLFATSASRRPPFVMLSAVSFQQATKSILPAPSVTHRTVQAPYMNSELEVMLRCISANRSELVVQSSLEGVAMQSPTFADTLASCVSLPHTGVHTRTNTDTEPQVWSE